LPDPFAGFRSEEFRGTKIFMTDRRHERWWIYMRQPVIPFIIKLFPLSLRA
jgi:hypothetical protein